MNRSDSASISAIVPAFRAAHYLERALPPLIALRDSGVVTEVIVVDDASGEPSTQETARRLGATVLEMKTNAGPSAARNHAARRSSGDILWFVDADVVTHDIGPARIRAALADEAVGAVFGSYDNNPPEDNFASTYKNLVHRYYHQRAKPDSDSFWSGCGAVRRSVFFDVGGFEEARFGQPAIEDVELGDRIRRAGWKIRLSHDFLGTHLKRWSIADIVRTDIFQRAAPWSALILSGRGVSDDLNVSAAERVKAAAACLWTLSVAVLFATAFHWVSLIGFAGLTLLVVVLNMPLIAFFSRERGPWFALRAVLFHQVYYLYSSATFVACAIRMRLFGADETSRSASPKPAGAE